MVTDYNSLNKHKHSFDHTHILNEMARYQKKTSRYKQTKDNFNIYKLPKLF